MKNQRRNFTQKEIISRSKKTLTNKFTGMNTVNAGTPNIATALGPKFQFEIENTVGTAHRVALFPANFATERVVDDGTNQIIRYDNPEELKKAGYAVHCTLDDGKYIPTGGGDEIIMTALNPSRTIRHFLNYIKKNAHALVKMTIISDDQNSFDTDFEIMNVNPFSRAGSIDVSLSTLLSRFQQLNDRIEATFAGNELVVSDSLLWIATLQPHAKMRFVFEFSPEVIRTV